MEFLESLFDMQTTLFEVLNYKMSVIEFVGTIFGLISVWLATKANIHTWTSGIINVSLFFIIFGQIQLYSDMFLQVFFFIASIIGFYQWQKKKSHKKDKKITQLNKSSIILISIGIIVFTVALGYLMSHIHQIWPSYFSKPASFPYADAFTTIMSIFATFLMAYKKVESWVLWIAVDVICVYLYFNKGVVFISIEYFIFLLMSVSGLIQWINSIKYAKRTGIR
jgi:nicotinamide mononucleotide transporter